LRLLGDPDVRFRFDVVEVVIAEDGPAQVELIQDVISLPEPYLY
jgi:hypothetical protein